MLLFSILIGVAFFLIVVLIAVHIGMKVQKPEETAQSPIIHASGIYSIVRRSPRESINEFKPDEDEIRQYLADKNEDIEGKQLEEADKQRIETQWKDSLENNLKQIETGDRQGVEFYYYHFQEEDPVCRGKVDKGLFVTREEIFRFPQIIPPFHLGCRCMLKAHQGAEDLRETTQLGMRPFFRDDNLPPLPAWNDILKLS